MSIKSTLVLLVLVLMFPLACFSESKILINEFLIDPQPQSVELINSGDQPVDLGGWVIDDNGGSSGVYTISSGTVLQPNSCLVFSKDFNLNKSSSDSARLFDSTMNLVDSYSYKSSPGQGISYSRIPDSQSWSTASATLGLFNTTALSCATSPTSTPLPTETPTPTPTSEPTAAITQLSYDNVYISEVMVNPGKDKEEWVEIFNNNDFTVNLADWHIDDVENAGSTPKKFSLDIPSKSYRAIKIGSSLFNNDGDSVRLLDFDKKLKDGFEYSQSVEGKTYGRISFDGDEYCLQVESFENVNNQCLDAVASPTPTPAATLTVTSPPANMSTKNKPKNITPRISHDWIQKTEKKEHVGSYEEILGVKDYRPKNYGLLIKHLSVISFSYSLLTVVSVLIKMTSIYAKRRFVFPTPFRPPRKQQL